MKKKYPIKTRYGSFMCSFVPEPDMGGYTAEALTIQGAVSWGKTLAKAKKMIAEAIEGVVEIKAVVNAEIDGSVRIVRSTKPAIVA